MTREDEEEFSEFARRTGDVIILPSKFSEEDIQPVKELPPPFSVEHWLRFLLFNRNLLSNLVKRYVPETGQYTIDALQSSVIEFLRSSQRDRTMRPGRIWAQFESLDKNRMIILPKEPSFKS
jgi:hypothetical protein